MLNFTFGDEFDTIYLTDQRLSFWPSLNKQRNVLGPLYYVIDDFGFWDSFSWTQSYM